MLLWNFFFFFILLLRFDCFYCIFSVVNHFHRFARINVLYIFDFGDWIASVPFHWWISSKSIFLSSNKSIAMQCTLSFLILFFFSISVALYILQMFGFVSAPVFSFKQNNFLFCHSFLLLVTICIVWCIWFVCYIFQLSQLT